MHECHQCTYMHGDMIPVYPGIFVSYNNFEEEMRCFHHDASPFLMEINHCHYGRVGWDLNNHTSLYIGEGDISLHSAALCSDSVMRFPLGSYQGITMVFDLKYLETNLPEILQDAKIDLGKIKDAFCKTDSSVLLSSHEETGRIFDPLYHLPEEIKLPYLKLKVQEILLLLSRRCAHAPSPVFYNSDITNTIREVHKLLTEHPDKRYTIEELSSLFHINTSTLKEVFKAIYGMPIAGYMKEYRIRHGAKLLRHTSDSIADIALAVGYETQSKFTKAFKEILGITPSEYRKKSGEH